ncbi:MAG: aminomethyl-transferring glycine dehydrogenase [Verrucomicrobiota bacterium]
MATETYLERHMGGQPDIALALANACGFPGLEALIDAAVPASIRLEGKMPLPSALTEQEALAELGGIMGKNRVMKSCIGEGYHGTITPPVILRNILENPGWYTAYTPYQAEIAQGRLEALLNFQTVITELTGLAVANASLLDEGTAAAEAVSLCHGSSRVPAKTVFIDSGVLPNTIAVVKTRMEPLNIGVTVGDWKAAALTKGDGVFAVILQYPTVAGTVEDYAAFVETAHAAGAQIIVAADLLALTLLKPPGEWGADIAVGNTQRFGVPMGAGGPHAGYMAVKDELKRKLPGRLVGVSVDRQGQPAMRLSLQTREQHIRRDKATSNICTAQVLLAVIAGMYAVYHGPEGLKRIASRVHSLTARLAAALELKEVTFFDTLTVPVNGRAEKIHAKAIAAGFNLRVIDADHVGVTLDETTTESDLAALAGVFGVKLSSETSIAGAHATAAVSTAAVPVGLVRDTGFLKQEVFHRYHTEHEMLRYLNRLAARDLTLCDTMIALGSCTMKLNATSVMLPLSWPTVSALHPLAPAGQLAGYAEMVSQLEQWLAVITGFDTVSIQPNAGSQGEYAGLLAIRAFHESRGEGHRRVCLIPTSAHGTNPASAAMCGLKVVAVKCDNDGNIDLADLRAQAEAHAANLAALMITYPSTHGVFEETIREICQIIHAQGGQVYMDGANMNAQVGLTSPGSIGADVCHLNLHKTFCIPHGGGGPGVGPVCVAGHLTPFLPGRGQVGAVSAAPWGSASILTISWMYIRMMGPDGLTLATKWAILNANYVAKRLSPFFPVLYKGRNGLVAHECIIDVRPFKETTGVSVEDVAKRLIDYGYHAPTMSWPVAGTLMIEPTESESRRELDRFCDAMISIHGEIRAIETGEADREDNVLTHAPHTAAVLLAADWPHAYTRESAAFPDEASRRAKYWPPVSRIDNVYGDKNLVCTCDSVEAYAERG